MSTTKSIPDPAWYGIAAVLAPFIIIGALAVRAARRIGARR